MTAATAEAVKTNGKKVAPRAPRDHEVERARDGLGNIGQVFPDAVDGTVPKSEQKVAGDEAKPVPVPRFNAEIQNVITGAMEKIDALEANRAAINAEINAVIEDMESRGINRHAFRYVKGLMKMSERKREGYDTSYMLCRQAVGQPLQQDWVDSDGGGDTGTVN